MAWQDVHRYYAALHCAEADLDRAGDGVVVWRPEYEDVFGTPHRLLLALRTYWNTMVQAQIEWDDTDNWRRIVAADRLAAAHPGLVRALRRTQEDAQVAHFAPRRTNVIAMGAA